MQPFEIESFLEKYAAGTHTDAEHQAFKNWLTDAPVAEIEKILSDYSNFSTSGASPVPFYTDLLAKIEAGLGEYESVNSSGESLKPPIIYRTAKVWLIAAIVFGVILVSGWLIVNRSNSRFDKAIQPSVADHKSQVPPGGNKALLTLGDGSVISLTDEKDGQIAKQGNVQVTKTHGGQLQYKLQGCKTPSEVVYNSLSTPRGGQFKLMLPDGSQAWLNAASSIKYPTVFTGKERKVEISGEVYFEIAHNAKMPFIVSVNQAEIKVLGTHFNVNAYSDEMSMKTSLLEGCIELSKSGNKVSLKPGQQAQLITSSGNIGIVNDVNMEEVVAWKNGYFSFNKADLQTVMRQIARWYDVQISYEGVIPQRLFGGKIDRNSNASEVLEILEASKVHFTIDNKRIIVKP